MRSPAKRLIGPSALALVVVDLPLTPPSALIVTCFDDVRIDDGAMFSLQCCREYERLERRAWLPFALRREVELVLVVIRAADHCAGSHRDRFCVSIATSATAGFVPFWGSTFAIASLRDLLQAGVECRRPPSGPRRTRLSGRNG